MEGRLTGRVALITGAGRNIGRAAAELFTAEGAQVAAVDLDHDRGREVVDAITAVRPDAAHLITADVAKEVGIERLPIRQPKEALPT